MTKPVTSVAAMMLYEEGAFELTDPISKWLPEFADTRVYVAGSAHEAGHRAADRADPGLAPAHPHVRADLRLPPRPPRRRDLPGRWATSGARRRAPTPPRSAASGRRCRWSSSPAASWNYGVSTDVLGRLVEVISGQPLDEFFAAADLRPARHARHVLRSPPGRRPRVAGPPVPGARPGEPGGPSTGMTFSEAFGAAAHRKPAFLSGGGGLVSTAGDYLRFVEMLRRGGSYDGGRLLGPAHDRAHGPQPPARQPGPGDVRPAAVRRDAAARGRLRARLLDGHRPGALRRRRQPRRLQLGRGGVHGVLRRPGRGRDRAPSTRSCCPRARCRSATTCAPWSTRPSSTDLRRSLAMTVPPTRPEAGDWPSEVAAGDDGRDHRRLAAALDLDGDGDQFIATPPSIGVARRRSVAPARTRLPTGTGDGKRTFSVP